MNEQQLRCCAASLIIFSSLAGCSRLRDFAAVRPQAGAVSVSVEPPKTEIKYLDGIYWPQGKACGRAYTFWSFMCRPEFQLQLVPAECSPHVWVYTVTGVAVHTALPLRTWLPFGVKDKLRAHEAAHIKMCEEIYKSAGEAAEQCGKELMGAHIRAAAADEKTAFEDAKIEAARTLDASYREKMETMADRAGVAFDRITNHGMNEVPEEQGMKQAFEECRKAPQVTPSGSQKK